MACYIRQKEGDDLVESGEFAETQVQRPPEQHSSISPYISVEWSLLSKGLRGGKSRRLRVESLLRRMLQSARSKRPHRTLCFGRKCNVRRNSDGGGSIWWVESMVLRSWSGDLPGLCVFSWHFVGAL